MESKIIEKKAYDQMKEAFDNFVSNIKKMTMEQDIKRTWMNNQDVCILLNISKRTLQHYRDSGKLPFSLIGRKCYYKTSDIEKFMADLYVK